MKKAQQWPPFSYNTGGTRVVPCGTPQRGPDLGVHHLLEPNQKDPNGLSGGSPEESDIVSTTPSEALALRCSGGKLVSVLRSHLCEYNLLILPDPFHSDICPAAKN